MRTLFFVLFVNTLSAQNDWVKDRSKEIKIRDGLSYYLDTVSFDTLFYYISYENIKSKEGVILSHIPLGGGMTHECSCVQKPFGIIFNRYRNGNYKEIGEYRCRFKAGTWTYFYENGNVSKIENYDLPYKEFPKIELPHFKNKKYLLSGKYVEYYQNGVAKIEGDYEIIEEYSKVDTIFIFDPETYEETNNIIYGDFWFPKSVKVGEWIERDETGKVINRDNYYNLNDEKKYRSIFTRYVELLNTNLQEGKE